jgi:hypothetical protein
LIRRIGLVSVLTGVAGLVLVAPGAAFGATTLGATPTADNGCAGDTTYIQSQSPGAPYTAPFDGVITSWSYRPAGGPPDQIKLKVGHPAPGSDLNLDADFAIVGESGLETPIANTLNTYPTRITTHAGDDIGFYLSASGGDCETTDSTYHNQFNNQDVLPGTTQPFLREGGQLSVSAVLEPDADHDGFGDNTQDQCPTNGSTQGPCPATGQRAAALKKCKKKHSKKARKKCRKKARQLPV